MREGQIVNHTWERTIRENRTGPIDFSTKLGSRHEACQLTVNNDVHGFATDMHQSDRPVTGVLAFILINPLIDSKHCVNRDVPLPINELRNTEYALYFDVETRNSYFMWASCIVLRIL